MRLALDIGGTFIKCACVTDEGKILVLKSYPTDPGLETTDFESHIITTASDFISESEHGFDMVGVGMAGFTDGKRGIILESPNLPGVKNLKLAEALGENLGIPVYVENDATAAAWGEYLFSNHGGIRNMLVVTLGTGIGGGLVLNGSLYRGETGMAGEIGHSVLEPDGPGCPCGARGCLEKYIGKEGLMEDYRSLAGLTELVEPKIIQLNALAGDTNAIEAWRNYGRYLGISLAAAATLLDLGVIVLTGGIVGAWDFFKEALMEAFQRYSISPHKDRIKIKKTTLDGNAGILGAAFLDKAK